MKYSQFKKGLHVFEADPKKGQLALTYEKGLQTLDNIEHDYWHKRYGEAKCKINVSLFNTNGSRNGSMYVDGYSLLSTPRENDNFIEAIWQKHTLIIDDLKGEDYATKYPKCVWFVGVQPLMYKGERDKRKPVIGGKHPRTAFGQKKDGTIVMFVSDGRPFNLTVEQTYLIMEELGCYNAVLCDGGGSSGMMIEGKKVNVNEDRKVYDALCFYSNEKVEIVDAKKKHTVLLDAGHYMYTEGKETPAHNSLKGSLGNYIKEAEQNYPIMFKVKSMLENYNVSVHLTNEDIHEYCSLNSIVAIEKTINPDIFVSIHKNATANFEWNPVKGTETYCYKFGGNGEKLARLIHDEVIAVTGDKDRGVKEGNFQVLRETNSPAVLCELGFMTNLEDAKDMLDEKKQQAYAEGIAKGILKYFGIEYKKEDTVQENVNNAVKLNLLEELTSLTITSETLKHNLSLLEDDISNLKALVNSL